MNKQGIVEVVHGVVGGTKVQAEQVVDTILAMGPILSGMFCPPDDSLDHVDQLEIKVSKAVEKSHAPTAGSYIAPAEAKVLSPLKNVVEFLVPVAVSLAKDTVLSEGVPMFNTSPNTIIKSITSDVVSAFENIIVEPDIV
jgi:hypothetical protein